MATTSNFSWPTPDDDDLVRDGASAMRALGNAIDTTVAGGYLYAGTRYYTSSGTFAKADPFGTGDIGLRAVRVTVVGAGGGGGGVATTGAGQVGIGGGGAGGGYSIRTILASSLSASETVSVGSGGTGGTANLASTGNGGTGGTSSFGSFASATGGLGGLAALALEGPPTGNYGREGGIGSSGDINGRGQEGGLGTATTLSRVFSGPGGASLTGNGGRSSIFDENGITGAQGGGGSGAAITQSKTGRAGGAGGAGVVIVDCYV